MKKNFIEELKWRGMLHDIMPGTEELLNKEMVVGYIGFDPTADSLGVGNLVQIMTLLHFQKSGHKPIALVGGATGMVGDPSGKSAERNLLDEHTLNHNLASQRKQLEKFLDFNCGANAATIVNNYDWFKNFTFLDFIRDVGKHITVNYMIAKDSVKNRLENGMSFTEFSYQLVQGYDFYYLWKHNHVKLQMGGSDQWGNIVTGTELIRRKEGGEAFALTTPLIKKADGTKFGKTEGGNVWLDRNRTSPYKFYQFWLNASDEDVKKYIRIFTLMNKEEVEALEAQHDGAPHLRILQKTLAKDITIRVHSEEDYNAAVEASEILFGKGTTESLKKLSEEDFLGIFEGVEQFEVEKSALTSGVNVVDLLTEQTKIFPSKGEARKMIQGGGVAINKTKVDTAELIVDGGFLINSKYILAQKGKKNYFVIKVLYMTEIYSKIKNRLLRNFSDTVQLGFSKVERTKIGRINPFETFVFWNIDTNIQNVGIISENLGQESILMPEFVYKCVEEAKRIQEKSNVRLKGDEFDTKEIVFSKIVYLYTNKLEIETSKLKEDFLKFGLRLKIKCFPDIQSEKRIAFICGNSNYEFMGNLKNCINDAEDIEKSLTTLGFDTHVLLDFTKEKFQEELKKLKNSFLNYNEILFFYSGHGYYMNGNHYIVPVDSKIVTLRDLEENAVRLDEVFDATKDMANPVRIFILDSCRIPSLSDYTETAMERISFPNSFIAYGTSIGSTAKDGILRNGRFTSSIMKHILKSNVSISDVFESVNNEVNIDTDSEQIPWFHSSLTKEYMLNEIVGSS